MSEEITIKCALCGANVKTNSYRTKYCDVCRDKARYMKRKEWERRTDYNTKQRDALRERRAKALEIKTGIIRAEQQKEAQRKREDALARQQQYYDELQQKALDGDAHANMQIEFSRGGHFNPNFWHWMKLYEIERAKSSEKVCRATVNGISVYDEGFEAHVVNSINELGRVYYCAF